MPENHPLSSLGKVTILFNGEQPIYAADVMDEFGKPVLPRQEPYAKAVQLYMTYQGEADEGA